MTDIVSTPSSTWLRIVEVDADHATATASNMLFVVWRGATKRGACVRIKREVQALAQRYPEGVGVLQTVEGTATPPNAAARDEILVFLDACRGMIKHYSIVNASRGFFKAVSVRAVVSGFRLYARPGFPYEIFGSLSEAATWHVQHQQRLAHPEITAGRIAHAIQVLRVETARLA